MARTPAGIDEQDLERALLRKSVGTLSGTVSRCADCGRTPLIGETLHHYAGGASVCELCKPLRREQPVHSERVHSSEYGQAVRIHRIQPASSPAAVPQ
ncbi:MAG TPA: hypothetical protein VMY78_08575 [Solirubrobacteraceae bacterium]|nr:hypothetical protein [Solirubrobacteraceae bacterium]